MLAVAMSNRTQITQRRRKVLDTSLRRGMPFFYILTCTYFDKLTGEMCFFFGKIIFSELVLTVLFRSLDYFSGLVFWIKRFR